MKYTVDLDACQNHGQCAYAAPSVFTLDDDGTLALRREAGGESIYRGEVGDDQSEAVEDAASMCPLQAIETEG